MAIRPGHGGKDDQQGVDGVEDRLLVLLEVTVVGQGQALERREQAGEVADQAAGLPARELRDVGVLLLRHDARPGRPRVVEPDEAELGGRPEHDLLGEPAQVDAGHGRHEGELGHEVAGRGAVDGVGARVGEAELRRHGPGVEPEAGPGERARAVRRVGGHAGVPVAQPVDVAQQRPRVGEQVVGQQDRLGVLEVGPAGHDHVEVVTRPGDERVDEVESTRGHVPRLVAQVGLEQRRDLVVARPAGAEPTAHLGPDVLDQQPLEGTVHVLVGGVGEQGPRGVRLGEGVEAGEQRAVVVVGEQAGGVEGVGMGARPGEVVGHQPPVEVGRPRQRLELGRRAAGEAAAPELPLVGRPGHPRPLTWSTAARTKSGSRSLLTSPSDSRASTDHQR